MLQVGASSRPPSRPKTDNELDELAFLNSFKLWRVKDGKNLTAMVSDAITEAELEMTIEGAGTLTLTINDPDWVILTSGVFDRHVDKRLDKIDVKVDHRWYRLVQVQAQGATLTLTCEEREVAYLRGHRKLPGKGKWSRSEHTRAEFVRHLVRQVKAGGGIDMLIYELHKKQPIEPVRADSTDTSRKDDTSASDPFKSKNKIGKFDSSAYGPPWDAMQGTGVTARGVDLRPAKKKYGIAIDPDYKLNYDKNYYIWPNPFDYKGTFVAFDTGGAITGNRIDFYDWRGRKEQYAWGRKDVTVYKAHGGDSVNEDDTTTTSHRGRYEYKVESGERFWDTIQRLAQEPVIDADTGEENPLGWRGFMQNYRKKNGKLGVRFVFAAEEDLLSRGRKLTIHREGANVTDFSFDWDQGKKVAEAQLQLLIDRWAVDPGEVIAVRDAGPATGNWLVTNIRRSLFSPVADITLKQPMPEQKEPAPEIETVDSDGEASPPGDGKGEVVIAAGANRAGVSLTKNLKDFLKAMASHTDETVRVTTGTAHNQFTTSGNVSDHWDGNAADLGIGSNMGLGDKLAAAALMACGVSRSTAKSWAHSGQNLAFNHDYEWNGLRVQIGWRTNVGGNHFNHVHVGVKETTMQFTPAQIRKRTGGP